MTVSLPAWPEFNEASPSWFFVSAAKVFNNFRGFGESIPFSIAMVVMGQMEADFQTGVVGDKGTAFGLWQEHADRAAAIKKATGIDLLAKPAPSIKDQCIAAQFEFGKTEMKARDAMRKEVTAAGAAAQCTALFERAGAAGAVDRRAADGTRWSAFIGANMAWVEAQGV